MDFSRNKRFFMTEKFADKKGIIEEKKEEYTKGLGKIELFIGVLFIAFERIIQRYLVGKYSAILFFAVMIVILIYFSKWSKNNIL